MNLDSPSKKRRQSSNADLGVIGSLSRTLTDGLRRTFTDGLSILSRDAHATIRTLAQSFTPDNKASKDDKDGGDKSEEDNQDEEGEDDEGHEGNSGEGEQRYSSESDEGNADCDEDDDNAVSDAKLVDDLKAALTLEANYKKRLDTQMDVVYEARRKLVIRMFARLSTEWSANPDLASQDFAMSWCYEKEYSGKNTVVQRLSRELFYLSPVLSDRLSACIANSTTAKEFRTLVGNKDLYNSRIIPELHCMLVLSAIRTGDSRNLLIEESSKSVRVCFTSFPNFFAFPLSKQATDSAFKGLRDFVKRRSVNQRSEECIGRVLVPSTARGSARISGEEPDFSISTAGGDDTRLKRIGCITDLIGTVIDSKNQGWNIILWIGIGRCEEALEILKNDAWCAKNRIKIFGVELNTYADLTANNVKSERLAVRFGTNAAFNLAGAFANHFPVSWGLESACHIIGYTTALIGPQFSRLLMKQIHKIEEALPAMRFTHMTGFTKQIQPFTDALSMRSRGISGTTVGNTSFSMNYVHRDDFLSDEDLDSLVRNDALIDCNNMLMSRFSKSFQGNSVNFFFPKPANYNQAKELMLMNVNADTPYEMKKTVDTLWEIYGWAWHGTDKQDFSDQLLEFLDKQNHPWSKKVRSYLQNPAEYKSNFENVARPIVQPLSRKRLVINPRDEVEEYTTDTEEDHKAKTMEPWEYVNEAFENLTLKMLSRKSKELRLGLANSYNTVLKHWAENANITRNTRPITIAIGMVMLSNESAADLRVNDSMNIKDSKALDTIRIKNLLDREKINENDLLTMSIGITGFSNSKYKYSKNCHEADCTNEGAVFKVVEPYILYKKVGRVIIDYNRVTGDYFNNILRGQTGKSILQIRVFAAAMAKGAAIYIPWPSPRNINDLEAFLNDLGGDVRGLFDIQIQPLGTHPFYEVDERLIGKGEKSRVGIDHSIPEYQKCAPLVIMLRNNMEYEYQ